MMEQVFQEVAFLVKEEDKEMLWKMVCQEYVKKHPIILHLC